jgi:hypothetical protein
MNLKILYFFNSNIFCDTLLLCFTYVITCVFVNYFTC